MMLAFALILCAAGHLGSIAGPVVPPTCRAAGQLPAGCPRSRPSIGKHCRPVVLPTCRAAGQLPAGCPRSRPSIGKHCRPRGAADVPHCQSTPGGLPHAPGRLPTVPALRPRAPGPRCCPPGRLSNRGRMRLETLTVGKVGLKGTSWRARAGGSSAACGRPAAVDGRRSGYRLAAGDPGNGPRPTNLLDARSNCCRGGRFKSV